MVRPRYTSERISTFRPTPYVVHVCVPCISSNEGRLRTLIDGAPPASDRLASSYCFGEYVSCQYDAAPGGRFSICERNSVTLHISDSLKVPSHAGIPVYRTPVRTT